MSIVEVNHLGKGGVQMLDLKRITEFEEFVARVMDDQGAPGITVALAQGDEVIYTKAFGYRSKERGINATTATIFGIASITKSITGIAVAQLVEQGLLSFDDPVVKHLPEFRLPGGGGEDVTIHHFLTHTSSMPPLPALGISIRGNTVPDKSAPNKKESTEPAKEQKEEPPVNTYSELIDYIATHECDLLGKPGEFFSYSNDAYALLGAIIMKVSGLTYSAYIRENIFKPLGMTRSLLNFEEMREHTDVTDLYWKNEDEEMQVSTNWQAAPPYLACGWVKTCTTDLIRIFQMLANGGEYKGVRLLKPESVKNNIAMSHNVSLYDSYGHGLRVKPNYHGVTLVEHGGALKGVSSNGGFVPEKGISAVVLCNLSAVPVAKVWLAAINLGLGLPIDTPKVVYEKSDWAQASMERFTGAYKSGEGAEFDIVIEEGELWIKYKKDHCVIKRLNDITGLFVLKGQEMEIRFNLDETGKSWGVGIGVRIIPKA